MNPDGHEIFEGTLPRMPVPPGTYRLRLEIEGRPPKETTVEVAGGGVTRFRVPF